MELAKGLKSPTVAHWTMLKRGAQYLKNKPRLIHLFPSQQTASRLDVWCDADHAGCLRTRKSTTGYCIRIGGSTTKSQAVIALSSGEAEYYSLTSAACNALGEQSVLRDWGLWFPIHCWMDSNTGLSIGSRHGLGKVKHIDIVFPLGTRRSYQQTHIPGQTAHLGHACRPAHQTLGTSQGTYATRAHELLLHSWATQPCARCLDLGRSG